MALFKRGREKRTVTIHQSGTSFPVDKNDSILNHALASGIPFPHDCTVGTCSTCKSKLLSGKVREITDAAIALTAEELRAGYILPCQAVAKTALELDVEDLTDTPEHPLVYTEGEITRQQGLTHDIQEIGLKLDRPIEYTAGQYAELRHPDQSGPRSYSFAHAPTRRDKDYVNFYIRKTPGGEFTEWLFSGNRIGTVLAVDGPFGNLWLRPGDSPVLCVAGGSGLAPIKALLESACDEEIDREFVFVFGARAQRDLYCVAEAEGLREFWGERFRFIPALSEEPEGTGWQGRRGLVTDVTKELPTDFLTSCQAYVCGPPPMVDAVEEQLVGMRSDETTFFHADRFLDKAYRRQ